MTSKWEEAAAVQLALGTEHKFRIENAYTEKYSAEAELLMSDSYGLHFEMTTAQ